MTVKVKLRWFTGTGCCVVLKKYDIKYSTLYHKSCAALQCVVELYRGPGYADPDLLSGI